MRSLSIRRAAAWCVDWVIIVGYAAALIPLGILLYNLSVRVSSPTWNLVLFALLIAPATVWLALWEAGRRAASPGKRLLRLQVRTADDQPVSFARALLRNGIKVALPWELGHTAAFTLSSPSASGPPVIAAEVSGIAACVIALTYAVSLIVGTQRTPYDRLAGTLVADRRGR